MVYNIQIGENKMSLPVGDEGVTPLPLLTDHHQGPLGGGQHEQGLTLEQRDIKTSDLSMEGGPHLNSQDDAGNTALHSTACQGHLEFVNALINYGARKDIPNIMENLLYFGLPSAERCSQGNHLLHYAASSNSDLCLTRFWDLQQGLQRLALPVNSEGRTPLHILAFNSTNDNHNAPQQEYKDLETFL